MKLKEHIKYRRNRVLSYYLLDFTPKERLLLWRNFIINKFFSKKVKEIEFKPHRGKITTYVISLNSRVDRRIHVIEQMKDNGLQFKFYTAINGCYLTQEDYSFVTKRSRNNLSKGSLGCAISHMKVWETISKHSDNEMFLILEDDVVLTSQFRNKLDNLLKSLPVSFDLIFLGGFNNRERDILYFVKKNLYKSYNPRRGLYSYLVTPLGARRMLKLIKPFNLLYGGIDTTIGKLTRNGQLDVYQVLPSIVEVDYGFSSNIFNYSLRNKKWVEDPKV